jgi:hypothetical protein
MIATSNFYLTFFASFLIAFAGLIALTRAPEKYTLPDLYVFSIGIFFGVYSLAKPPQFLAAFPLANISLYLSALLVASTVVTWFSARFVMNNLLNATQKKHSTLQFIFSALCAVKNKWLASATIGLLCFQLYAITHYHVTYIAINLSSANHYSYLFLCLHTLYPQVLFCVALITLTKLLSNNTTQKYILAIFAFFLILLLLFLGRRVVFYLLFLTVLIYLVQRPHVKLLSIRTVLLSAFCFLILFAYSNFFQAYRNSFIHLPSRQWLSLQSTNPLYLLTSNRSYTNLEQRPFQWGLAYRILKQHDENHQPFAKGQLFATAVISVIPRFLWPEKPTVATDVLLHQQLNTPSQDFSDSLFSMTLADFGWACVFAIALLVSLFFFFIASLSRWLIKSPGFYALFIGSALFYLLSIESNYIDYLLFFRNALLLVGVFFAYSGLHALICTQKTPLKHAHHE